MEIAADIIKILIAPISGLIGAFGGAYLSNLFAEKRWAKQVESDQGKERRNILRAKGEDAYFTLKKWEKELYAFHSSRIGHLQGSILKHEMDKIHDTKTDQATHAKLSALLELYFPDLNDQFREIEKQITIVNGIYHRQQSNLFASAGAAEMINESAVYERLIMRFAKRLRDTVRAI